MAKPTAEERFWSKVRKTETCWLWTGAIHTNGYGGFYRGPGLSQAMAHRFAYELLVGPIPGGLQLDHLRDLCGHKNCVKVIADEHGPAHLEPVTCQENLLRGDTWQAANAAKTHCPQGHPYDEVNVYVHHGRRFCRICRSLYRKRVREARRLHGNQDRSLGVRLE